MREDLGSADRDLWFGYAFGGPQAPRWALYTIGFSVVQSYLERHPNQNVEEWIAVEARKIIEESGYDGEAP